MAHKIEILRGATTYVLNDPSDASNPFSVEDGAGLGGASVRNIEERGPYQDGASHLDERLEPSVSTWRIFVKGTTAAALDGHRDTLNKMFKPIRGVPIIVKYTRDDGAIRYQDTRRTGPLDIPLVKEHRPGNLHKAVVQLRAADPTWYDPTVQTVSFGVPSGNWWLGYATIGTANVLEHVESPGTAQRWTNAGSVATGQPWTIPDGLIILHSCDTPACVRVSHLRLGTHADNSADKTQKGRTPHGETHYRTTLTENQIVEIRQRYAAGSILQYELAAEYAVSKMTISNIINFKVWPHVR